MGLKGLELQEEEMGRYVAALLDTCGESVQRMWRTYRQKSLRAAGTSESGGRDGEGNPHPPGLFLLSLL